MNLLWLIGTLLLAPLRTALDLPATPPLELVQQEPSPMATSQEQVIAFWLTDLPQEPRATLGEQPLRQKPREVAESGRASLLLPWMLAAARGELEDWKESPRGRLALVLLLDQLPRQLFHETPAAFAFDKLAQRVALEGIELGDDQLLSPEERRFFYMPLHHSEEVYQQQLASILLYGLIPLAPAGYRDPYQQAYSQALHHRQIVQQFGRFPQRNGLLGRLSTPEELSFLQKAGE